MIFCTECGTPIPDNNRFCTKCGTPAITAQETAPMAAAAPPVSAVPIVTPAAATIAPQIPPTPAVQVPARPVTTPMAPTAPVQPPPAYYANTGTGAALASGNPYAVVSTGSYIGMMLLFMIPVIGWIACIVMIFASKNKNRRNFAKATLIFLIISIIISILCYFVFTWIWEAVMEYFFDGLNTLTPLGQ